MSKKVEVEVKEEEEQPSIFKYMKVLTPETMKEKGWEATVIDGVRLFRFGIEGKEDDAKPFCNLGDFVEIHAKDTNNIPIEKKILETLFGKRLSAIWVDIEWMTKMFDKKEQNNEK